MEAKRQKLMDESELDELIVYDPELDMIDDLGTSTDDEKLRCLLEKWGTINFYEILKSNGINYCDLHTLEETDYSLLLRNNCIKIKELSVFRDAHREWKKNATQNCELKKILENGGGEITSYYKLHSKLTDPLRERLVAMVIKGREISRPELDNLATQICTIFPGESKSVYYEKIDTNRNPTGLLYVRYCQSRRTKAMAKSVESEEAGDADLPVLLTDEVQISVDFVNDKENFQDLATVSFFEHWRACYAHRYSKKCTASEFLDEWPLLQERDAIPFILDDFWQKYGSDIANSMKTKWKNFIFKNMTVLCEGIKNPRAKKDLLQSQSEIDSDASDLSIFLALHYLHYIVPTRCIVKNKTWTPSIPESQDAFLKMVTNSNAIAKKMNAHKVLHCGKAIPDHPIIFEEKSMSGARNYYVAVCQTIYDCPSLIEAVDATFKYYVMLKIPFPPQCEKLWLFLNQIFYKIDLPQKPNFKMLSILNDLHL